MCFTNEATTTFINVESWFKPKFMRDRFASFKNDFHLQSDLVIRINFWIFPSRKIWIQSALAFHSLSSSHAIHTARPDPCFSGGQQFHHLVLFKILLLLQTAITRAAMQMHIIFSWHRKGKISQGGVEHFSKSERGYQKSQDFRVKKQKLLKIYINIY